MHSPQGGSHTLCGKFPCMCPACTHMSSKPDEWKNSFLNN